MDSIAFSEYMLIGGIIIMIANMLATFFLLLYRPNALYLSGKVKILSNIFLIIVEISFIAVSVFFLNYEQTAAIYAFPLLCIAISLYIMLAWGFIQMKASLLLDIGKLGIPRSIINKKGKLLPEERELIQKHPEICMEILSSIPSLKTITFWIKYHHERVDGAGYYHLKGEEIPLASRILAIADTYSAITMDRSYRPSLPYENAISELRLVAGKQLDGELVELFCSIPKSKITVCMNDVRNRMKKYQSGTFR